MRHQERREEQLELGNSYELVLKERNFLKNLLATSYFEIVLILFYLGYDQTIRKSKLIQVKHFDQATARAGILKFGLFNIKSSHQ